MSAQIETGKSPETCTQSGSAYRVEIRAVGRPVRFGNELIGNEWCRLPTVYSPSSPLGTSHQDAADVLTHTHNYFGAIALAASVMSQVPCGVETRIIRHRRTVTYELHREEALALPEAIAQMFADSDRHQERLAKEREARS